MIQPTNDPGEAASCPQAFAAADRRARLVPALLSADLERTAAFYTKLGFATEWTDGRNRPAHRLHFERDGICLFFFDEPLGSEKTPILSGTLYIFPDSVDALAGEWRGKVDFLWGPELMPYGLYEFGIADPDGYNLAFAERRAPSPR
jgi:catechol 2,3-dioxygenase-like lactoylglutathione lyase family enzyme